MSEANLLGDYLRARREQVTPADVGLPAVGVRRVAGLRREEVAMLAGISADYYLRLEQGRDRNPSMQVLESLARVLQLEPAGTDHLLRLAAPQPRHRPRRVRREPVPESTARLVEHLDLPAFVEGRYFDVLATNPLATALSPAITVGRNRLRDVFLDPDERALYPNLDEICEGMVAGFRVIVGRDADDPRCVQLVGELSVGSETFRRLWARADVRRRDRHPARFRHPQLGEITLAREKLVISGTDSQMLVIYHAEPGSPDADKLALLRSLTAPSVSPRKDRPVER